MDPIRLLKKDHRKVAKLFRKIEDTTNRAVKTREKLFTKIKMELDVHALIEEKHFYPALEGKRKTDAEVDHAYDEHAEVKQELKELERAPDKGDSNWYLRCMKLIKDVEHHVKEEESELLPDAKKVLSHRELWEIGDRMYETKQEALGKMK